ncbi:MAG: NIPSNAP family protein [Burkholderiaceae bacterium]
MIVDFRAYTLQSGTVAKFLELFEIEGLEPQVRILGNFLGIYRTEIGNINEIIMMFGYDDANERQRRRVELFKDPAFQAYLQKVRPMLVHQEVRMLVPSKCNPSFGKPSLG